MPPNKGASLPFDAGLRFDGTGNPAAGGGGAKFGGKWTCGGLAGLSNVSGPTPSPAPVYYRGTNRALRFMPPPPGGNYKAMYFSLQIMKFGDDGGTTRYCMLEPSGTTRYFNTSGRIDAVAGQCGNRTSYSYDSTSGNISEVVTTLDNGTNKYEYTWYDGRISEVVYKVESRPVLRTVCGYDGGGNLVTVKLYENSAAAGSPVWGSPVSASRYSYHTDTGLLRHFIPPAQYRQMVNNGIDPDTATESQLNEYASAEYFYSEGRVSLMYKNGRRYSYQFAYHYNHPSGSDLNLWTTRTTVTQSDGTQDVYYFNRIGQMMLHKVAESDATTAKVWYPLYQHFNPDNGRIEQSAGNSAIASVDDLNDYLVELKPHDPAHPDDPEVGMTAVYVYNSEGRRESVGIQNGLGGDVTLLRSWTYEPCPFTDKGTIYEPATETVYPTVGFTPVIVTSYDYDWYDNSFQYRKRTTTLPVIHANQNGRGLILKTEAQYNPRGFLSATVDQRGTVTEYTYDEVRGGMISKKEDVSGLNLITNDVVDDRGRTVLTLGPVHEIDIDGTPTSIRSANWTYYQDAEDGRWSFSGYRTATGPEFDRIVGPVTIEQSNIAPPPGTAYSGWRQSSVVQAAYTGTGIPSPDATFDRASWLRWSLSLYDLASELKEQRIYFEIPADGYGSRSVNYARKLLGYDSVGRPNQTTDADDTIVKTTYNAMGWAVAGETGTTAGLLTVVRTNEYDDDGNLTTTTLPVDLDSDNDRVTDMTYDWRSRRIQQTTTVEKDEPGNWTLMTGYDYDNSNQLIAVTDHADGVITSYQTSAYDDLGRLYRSEVYAVDSLGHTSNPQVSNRYYDVVGSVARDALAGSQLFTVTTYDAVGRTKLVSQAYEPSSSSPSSSSSSGIAPDPASVANAVVMSQQAMEWDNGGNLISTTAKQRFDDATGYGDLGTPTSTTKPKARVSYQASYADARGRTIATADYGTNGGNPWSRPQTVPDPSDDVLVSTSFYDTAGDLSVQTDPAGILTARAFDQAGRLTTVIENSAGGSGNTRTTRYEYTDDNGLKKLISQNPDTGEQVTEWVRGVTIGQGSAFNSNRLVFEKIYPDSSGSADLVTYTYNRQSKATGMTDQAGTAHAYSYDKLGRLLRDAVTFAPGTMLDTTVGRLETGYNERGLVVRSTSLDATGTTVVNEVRSEYNKFNQLITEWQEHAGVVTGTSLKVQYSYADGSANTLRPAGITSPDGTVINTGYTGTGNSTNLPDQISDETGSPVVLASMKYLGLGTVVELKYDAAANARLTMENGSTGDAGDKYTGLDRFGRLVETLWETASADLVNTTYGRNRAGGVVWQRNKLAHAMSPEIKTQDHYYWYDGLQQVYQHSRGELMVNTSPPPPYSGIANLQQQETFSYDETGNWLQYTGRPPVLDQHRTHDKANQIDTISHPVGVVRPAYDAVGNMTTMPKAGDWTTANTLQWDAWNRLVRVRCGSSSSSSSSSSGSPSSSSDSSSPSSTSSASSSGSSSSASSSGSPVNCGITYQYDALTRRTRKSNAAETRDYYYDRQWRAVEERVAGDVSASYVWSPVDRWTMIRRKRSVAGTLDETRYVLKDYLDPTAVINTSATVIERFGYDAFGPVTFMDAAFTPRAASACGWSFLFHAEFLDADSGLYNYGFRYYHPELGRWLSRDPIGEVGGLNLYAILRNSPISGIDRLGLADDFSIPKDETGCKDAIKYYEENDTGVKSMIEKIKKTPGCKKPEIMCNCCDEDSTIDKTSVGVYNYFSNVIKLCFDRINYPAFARGLSGMKSSYKEVIRHEYAHALQNCTKSYGFSGKDLRRMIVATDACSQSMCTEIFSYSYSNCTEGSEDIKRNCVSIGVGSSSRKKCPNLTNDQFDAKFNELYDSCKYLKPNVP